MYAQQRSESELWDVPYLPIDPQDLGRSYEAIIRVNSQSGKGGVAYLMETEHHLELPRGLQVDFAQKVQAVTDLRGDELTADELLDALPRALPRADAAVRARLVHPLERGRGPDRRCASPSTASAQAIEGVGNGPIAALVDAFERRFGIDDPDPRLPRACDVGAARTRRRPPTSRPTSTTSRVWGVGLHPSIVTRVAARGRQRRQPRARRPPGRRRGDGGLRLEVLYCREATAPT